MDFSGAVGLQVGVPSGSALSTSQNAVVSGLVKVTERGQLVDPLVEGSVSVTDFFIRGGHIYLLLNPSEVEPCVLAQADSEGTIYCVDEDIVEVDVRTIQFDRNGGIYYLGLDGDERPVIRYRGNEGARDYYRARDVITISRFVVTPDGNVLLTGESSGNIASSTWLRSVSPTGTVTNHAAGVNPNLLGFMPDGSVLVTTQGSGLTQFRRLSLHEGIQLESRWYAGNDSARFPDVDVSAANLQESLQRAIDLGFMYRTRDALTAIVPEGLLQFYPAMHYLDVPLVLVTNGDLGLNTVVASGINEAGENAAYLIELNKPVPELLFPDRNIELLRVKLQLDKERIVMYGLDHDSNQPVLGEYDFRSGRSEFADINFELADSFDILDWNVGHVAPEPLEWEPLPEFTYSAVEGDSELTVEFDGSATPDQPFIDEFSWSFGDDSTATGVNVSHTFAAPGIYEVKFTVVADHGRTGVATQTVEVGDPEGREPGDDSQGDAQTAAGQSSRQR